MSSRRNPITRRSLLSRSAAAVGLLTASHRHGAATPKTPGKGRLKQSVCKWCYRDMALDELARNAAEMGIVSVELLKEEEWPVLEEHGLICAVGTGICSIADGLNDKANHHTIEANLRHLLPAAKKHSVPNVICFSGNRRQISDEEAWDNCALLLHQVKSQAEELGVTIVMELLNSKVNHADYQCDKTPWGVELVKRVNSPRFKLLYDVYHMQIMEGDVIRTIRDNIDHIAHFHTGGNPGRHELDDTQELNYKAIAQAIVNSGFQGFYAHEFIPTRDPMTSLREAVDLCDV